MCKRLVQTFVYSKDQRFGNTAVKCILAELWHGSFICICSKKKYHVISNIQFLIVERDNSFLLTVLRTVFKPNVQQSSLKQLDFQFLTLDHTKATVEKNNNHISAVQNPSCNKIKMDWNDMTINTF